VAAPPTKTPPAAREPSTASFPSEPSAPAKSGPSKGVIVRDTPF
jgi:hypothetical protein